MAHAVSSAEWKRRVQKLSLTLGAELPESIAGQVDGLRAVSNLVCRRLKCGTWTGKRNPERDVEGLFSELKEDVLNASVNADKIWCALRLLNVAELIELQGEVNDLLGTVQSFTSNPKVNTSLGVVGK